MTLEVWAGDLVVLEEAKRVTAACLTCDYQTEGSDVDEVARAATLHAGRNAHAVRIRRLASTLVRPRGRRDWGRS